MRLGSTIPRAYRRQGTSVCLKIKKALPVLVLSANSVYNDLGEIQDTIIVFERRGTSQRNDIGTRTNRRSHGQQGK